jgi:hypothetical protein
MCQLVIGGLPHRASVAQSFAPNLVHNFELRLYEHCSGRSLCRVVVKARTNHRREFRPMGTDKRGHARSLLQYTNAIANLELCVGTHPMPGEATGPNLPHHNPEGVNVCWQANSCEVTQRVQDQKSIRSYNLTIRTVVLAMLFVCTPQPSHISGLAIVAVTELSSCNMRRAANDD